MRLALGSSQRLLLNTPPSRVAVSEDAEDNAYPPLSPLQRSSATPSQPPVHSPLQEFITPRETFTGATATQAASPPHMTTNPAVANQPLQLEAPQAAQSDLPEPDCCHPLPSARVSRHVTQAQHRASQDLLMDEMTVLQRDLDLMFREVQNLHEFNRALQLSPSTATLLQGTEPSYGVPYLANLSHQTGLSFKSTTGLLQCVNLMVLVDTGSGLNFISQSMADSLGHDPLPCHHKTIAFNDVKSSLTKEIQMPVIFCSDTPNEISVRATFVIAPDNTIFDALIGTPLMAMPGISALPDISQEKLTLRPFLHLSSAEHTATAFYMTLLMHMVTHAHSMESYSYETNSDNTLYLGDVNLLHRFRFAADAYAVVQGRQPEPSLHLPPQPVTTIKNPKTSSQHSWMMSTGDQVWPPASLLPGRLQGGLTSCLSHMDPNYLQEGGINNSMPDGAVTPNADRGALHPDCDLFIGHHRDGTEAQRKEMAAMLNRMTPAVARTMEDLREGYKGIVPPMHIEKDNDKQAFTSPYRKPPIEKLAQDKYYKRLIDIGLRIHPDKSCFALDAVDFLGFDVSNHGLTPQAAKVQAIKDMPYPSNLKDLKTILGAQHGNADALSRFPSPAAEDNTGARIDPGQRPIRSIPTVPTTPYVPLDLTLGHIVDYVLDVRSVLSICTTPLPAAVTYMAQNGITLYEMCGGMCAGLEAALRNGIQVNRLNAVNRTLGLLSAWMLQHSTQERTDSATSGRNLVDPLDLQLQLNKTRRTANISANGLLGSRTEHYKGLQIRHSPFLLSKQDRTRAQRNAYSSYVPSARAFRPDRQPAASTLSRARMF
eukprot:gene29838-biopygen11560